MALSPVTAWQTPYVSGLTLTYTSTSVVTVALGSCVDSTATNVITLSEPKTITKTVLGAGGLDVGTIAASTKYYIYAIGSSFSYGPGLNDLDPTLVNPAPGTVLISTSLTPSLPLNYDMYRYIGAVYTDGSSNFLKFVQSGLGNDRTMWYDVAIATSVTAGTSTTYANIDLSGSVPKAALEVFALTSLTPNSSASVTNLVPYGSTATVGYALVKGQVAAVVATETLRLPSASNAGAPYILYKTTSGSDAVAVSISGYVDQL